MDILQTVFLLICVVCIFLGRPLIIQFVKCSLPGFIVLDCESNGKLRDHSFCDDGLSDSCMLLTTCQCNSLIMISH